MHIKIGVYTQFSDVCSNMSKIAGCYWSSVALTACAACNYIGPECLCYGFTFCTFFS